MKSISLETVCGKSLRGVPSETLVETIWAVTHFVYTGENETEFMRYSPVTSGKEHVAAEQRLFESSTRSYRVDDATTPAKVAQSGHEKRSPDRKGVVLRIDTKEPNSLQLIKRVGLLVIRNGDQAACDDKPEEYEDYSALLSVYVRAEEISHAALLVNDTKQESIFTSIADTLTKVCDMIVNNWDTPLSQMSFMGPVNWQQIIDTASTPVQLGNHSLCDLLSLQSQVRPNQSAVEAWDGSFTYAQLLECSLRMATLLLQKGVSVEDRVGICMKKSKWALVAICGTILAGSIGVSLDIRNPRERMKELLQQVGARIVVTDQWLLSAFSDLDVQVVRCSSDALQDIDASTPGLSWPEISSSTAAFITFTGGSTGSPKAVVAEHGPLYAKAAAIASAIKLDENSRVFQFASFVSDGSLGNIFSTMFKGGCVCLPSEEDRLNDVSSALRKSRATHTSLTSTMISQIQPQDAPDLEYLVATGEALSKENFTRWESQVKVVIAYGITESIVLDSYATSEQYKSDHRNIGRANGGCLWIVHPSDPEQLKPVGAIGEILIEGPILAREYLGEPAKTAEKFISAPAWLSGLRKDKNNLRCYRSGDYGLRNTDGTILYLGRVDMQVKVRGWRVELGEIEHSLSVAEPSLQELAVEAATLQNRGGQHALVAFIKRASNNEDQSLLLPLDEHTRSIFQAAQSKLLSLLPRYMVPSLFVPIRNIPRTAVGKRDRKTLRSSANSFTEEQLSIYSLREATAAQPPKMHNQIFLQQSWAKVLRAAAFSMGLEDNFFQVGGDSLTAIELVAELRTHGRTLTVSDIFQSPIMRDMADQLSNLDDTIAQDIPQAFELISGSQSREKSIIEAAQACNLSTDRVEDIYVTSPLQEGLMAVTARRPGTYSHRTAFKLPESLDVERFKMACELLVAEQPIFRTRIVVLHSMGTMQVVTRGHVEWYTNMTLDTFFKLDDDTPFTYGTELSRFAIVSDESNGLNFAWSGHHAISDGWSRLTMYNELRKIYCDGTGTPQAPFTSFIKYLNQIDTTTADQFWREQFQDSVDLFPQLPSADYVPQALQSQSIDIDLRRTVRSGITTATLIQAAWAFITAAYANTDEAIFGQTLSGRDAPVTDINRIMGITIATVPVRIVLDYTNTVSEYLDDVQLYMSQVKQHQHVGLQRISHLSPEAQAAATFQNLLVIQPASAGKDHAGLASLGLELVSKVERDTSTLALTTQCYIDTENKSLHVNAHYDSNIIDSDQMKSVLHFFEHVLSQFLTESTTKTLHDIEKVSLYDLDRLTCLNDIMPSAVEKTLHGMIAEKARETPDAIALDGTEGHVTYAELDFLSTQLAAHLQQHTGIGIESRVVLSFAKSKLPVFAILAVLKCGGVCVSTNPEHPTTRLLELTKDAEADVVLCNEDKIDRFQNHVPHVIAITEALLEELKFSPFQKLGVQILPSNGSFIVYTSGSTGKPKGSVLEHRSLATDLTALGQRIGLDPQSRTLQFSAYTFDAHILEIIGTLIHGGCLCVISDSERMDSLPEVINVRSVNFALLTKTVSRLLEPEEVPTLKTLILSGEPNGRQDYQRWTPFLRLFNGMGPSECTPLVALTREPVAADDNPANIGHAMGCHLWIIDRQRPDQLVPIGCIGELAVEGPIVGRGYVNRPKQNAAAFLIDPAWACAMSGAKPPLESSNSTPRRLYRSGDLAKMNSDGSINFIGRADSQVKISGQRVELGEIEDYLRRCSNVFTNSAVEAIPISSRQGATALAVFCARKAKRDHGKHRSNSSQKNVDKPILPLDHETEQQFQLAQAALIKALPLYMVPSIFLPVKSLPFNPSGKLERKLLREWAAALNVDELGHYYLNDNTPFSAPETEREKQLQSLWAKVLNLPLTTIGAEANFFRLGGDSVLSMKLIAEARSKGVSMTVADVFARPVLKEMAGTMTDIKHSGADGEAVFVKPYSLYHGTASIEKCIQDAARDCGVTEDMVEDIYPCTPIQEALMAASSHRPDAYTYEIRLKLPRTMEISSFKSCWEKLASLHAIYRTRIVYRRDVGSLQVVLKSAIAWHDVTGISVEQYLKHNGTLLVEYGSELSRFAIIRHRGETVFVGILHHALYDGWSMMRTWEEFSRIFNGDQPVRQPVPFKGFIEHITSAEEEECDEFWRSQFPDIVQGYPRLPSGHLPRPQKNREAVIPFNRPVGTEITAATTIQGAWAILMSAYSGSEDVVFGLTLSGRDAPVDGITDMIGPTLTSVPFHMHLYQDMSLGEVLWDVQNRVAEIRRYQHVGLKRIRQLSAAANTAADFKNLLIVHTMNDEDITLPLRELGLRTVKSKAEETMDFALTVECNIGSDTLHVHVNYDDEVITDEQVDFMFCQLEHIVTVLTNSQTVKLRDIELVCSYDLEQQHTWNEKMPEYANETLHELVQVQVQKTPDAIATTGFDIEYTYSELDSTAERLAAQLRIHGVDIEKHVVLSFRKSTWPIVAMLAVLKSGGVCVSVNHEDPLNRRLEIVQDVEPVLILCDADQEKQYSGCGPRVMVVDDVLFATNLNTIPSNWTKPNVKPTNAAFIVYTSGSSSGKPKGCIIEHHAACLSQRINAEAMNITSHTRTLQFATYTWDPSILEIFGPLIKGGSVCVISDNERMNDLINAMKTRDVTWTFQTPTVAQLIDPKELPNLETIVFCGEPLTQKVLHPWASSKKVRLINFYSTAETSNIGVINTEPDIHAGLISIGRANGCGVWIVDSGNPHRLVPVGCIGEVIIEGHAVIRGYWRRPQENSVAFIDRPSWAQSGGVQRQNGRFYRTGDIGYFDHDGNVHLLGRRDKQVKLNGMRVELHEIEYQIHEELQPGAEVTVDIVQRDAPALNAFIKLPEFPPQPSGDLVMEDEVQVEKFQTLVDELQQVLPGKLPRHMVPSAFIPISHTPLLATTKTDRRSLVQFAQDLPGDALFRGGLNIVKEPPRNEVEKALQLVWSQVLKLSICEVGVDDEFLSLGGDSITAMQVVSECRHSGIKVLVSTILGKKTIMAIAPLCTNIPIPSADQNATIDEEANDEATRLTDSTTAARSELMSLLSDENARLGLDDDSDLIDSIHPCTAMQEGIILSQQMDPELYQFKYVWEFAKDASLGELSLTRLSQAWELMIEQHSSLRTIIFENASDYGHFVQATLKRHPMSRCIEVKKTMHEVADVLATSREEGDDDDDDSIYAYLPRLFVYTTADKRYACQLCVNHAFVDGVSMEIFKKDFTDILTGQKQIHRPMNFSTYVEHEYAMKSDLHVAYWVDYLQGVQPSQISEAHGNRNEDPDHQFGLVKLSTNAMGGLSQFCRSLGITQSAFIQAAWAIVLKKFTGQDDVCFGYIASSRDAPLDGIEGCIGPLISMQICRVRLQGTVYEALRRTHSEAVNGLDRRNCSLALIKSASGLKGTKLFNTCMTFRRALSTNEQSQIDRLIKPAVGPENTEFAVTVSVYVDSKDTQISISHQTAKISREHARLIAATLENVLQSLLESKNKPIRSIKILEPQMLTRQRKLNDGRRLQDNTNPTQRLSGVELDIQTVWAKVLNLPASRIGLDNSFMSLGGDSIAAMQVAAQCRKVGIRLPVSVILQKKTISAIAPHCKSTTTESANPQQAKSVDGKLFNLSPIQKRYFDQVGATGWTRYNQNMLCRIKQGVTNKQLRNAFDMIVKRHGMLRARFSQAADEMWQQSTISPSQNIYRFNSHLLSDTGADITPLMRESAQALDIVCGPVFSVDHFEIPDEDGMMFLVAHHLVIDIVSWQIIIREVEDYITRGKLSDSPSPTFQQWCDIQEAESASELSAKSVMPLTIPPSNFAYWQVPENLFGDSIEETFRLPTSATTLLLTKSNEAFGTTPLEIMLGPLLSTFHQAFPDRSVPSVFIEGHGRESCGELGIEPSQVVGWFTSMYPVRVAMDASTTAVDAIRSVKDARRKIPRNGRLYFAFRHLNAEGDKEFSSHDPIELLVNYTGTFHQLEAKDNTVQRESRVVNRIPQATPEEKRMAMIDIEIGVSNGVMTLQFGLNRRMAYLEKVQQWIQDYSTSLAQIVEDLAERPPSYTLSDFPLLNIDYAQLKDLLTTKIPSLGVASTEQIEEIFPVTPFQRFCLEGHLTAPPRQWSCLYFDVPKNSKIVRLQDTCCRIVEQTPILRTLFVGLATGYLQVVLKSLMPQIDVYHSEEAVDKCMERLFSDDLADLPPLGKPLLRFMIVRTPTHMRLLLRISHAQDDGFSRKLMVRALAATYDGQQVPRSVSFSNYVRHARQHHEEGVKYWRSVLVGAEPSRVLSINAASMKSEAIRVNKTLPPFPPLKEVTSATIFNAACAIMISSLVKSSDVTFGRITSARAGLESGLQDSLGPCVNIIPIRVQLPIGYGPTDVLQLVHKQYVESIPYETTGLDDIIHECTDWLTSRSKFPIITQHINQEEGYELPSAGGGSFGGYVWEPESEDPYPWTLCLAAFPSRDGVRISICANSAHTDELSLERIMDHLCKCIDELTQNLNA